MQVTLKGAGGSAGSRGTVAPAGTAEHKHQLRHPASAALPPAAPKADLSSHAPPQGRFRGIKTASL